MCTFNIVFSDSTVIHFIGGNDTFNNVITLNRIINKIDTILFNSYIQN